MKPLVLFTTLLMLGLSSVAVGEIRIKGSDTLGARMVPQLAEAYRKLHPEIRFEVAAEGSASCFDALLHGNCDIGMAIRPPNEVERSELEKQGINIERHLVGYSIIAVIAHRDNPVNELDLRDLEKIFTGVNRDWKSFGGNGEIVAYRRNSSSSTYRVFQRVAMRGKPYGDSVRPLYEGHPRWMFHKSEDRVQVIGYVPLAYANVDQAKCLAVDGVIPTPANAGRYPLTQKLWLVTREKPSDEAKVFINWCRTNQEAFDIIDRVGFTSLQDQATTGAEQDAAGKPATRPESK